ncbi:MAG: hypothetical protein L0Y57_01895 [Beijerinckiaceae bacterium]|nr:hypothetical protein [Beijerinckiaceae bacterium]
MAKKIKWIGLGTPAYTGPIIGGRPNGDASGSNKPTYNEPTDDDIFRVKFWTIRLGLPGGLTDRDLAICFARELEKLEVTKKKKAGRPPTLRTGAGAMKLAAEIQSLMEAGIQKEEAIRWLHGAVSTNQI